MVSYGLIPKIKILLSVKYFSFFFDFIIKFSIFSIKWSDDKKIKGCFHWNFFN